MGSWVSPDDPTSIEVSVGINNGIWGFEEKSVVTETITQSGKTYTALLGYVESGSYAFKFDTYGSSIKSDRVNLISHN